MASLGSTLPSHDKESRSYNHHSSPKAAGFSAVELKYGHASIME